MMKNVWLMKTYKEWAQVFIGSEEPFFAVDEPGVNKDYGALTQKQRDSLFKHIEQTSEAQRRWKHIQRFFDEFYDDVQIGDIIVLGTGQTSKFNVTAIGIVKEDAKFVASNTVDYRHRRKVKLIWQGEPFLVKEWGWANRLERLNTEERLKEYIRIYTELTI